jgi:UPF0755 protein
MKKTAILAMGIVLIVAWNPFWRSNLNEAVDENDTSTQNFQIPEGERAGGVANALAEKDLIVSKRSFLRALKSEGLDSKIQVGVFTLSPSMTLQEIIDTLITKGSGDVSVTFPEGWTIQEMDTLLTELELIKQGEFIACSLTCTWESELIPNFQNPSNLEGYLFPDTYFVNRSSFTPENFLQELINNFERKWADVSKSADQSGRSLQEIVTVASMLEEEAKLPEDFPLVAGIIWKRLDANWALGIDATSLYGKENRELNAKDLQEESPYNTRINKGLPPSAIGNPGLKALEAAANPEISENWFYINDPITGKSIYAKTSEEHQANIEKYLR